LLPAPLLAAAERVRIGAGVAGRRCARDRHCAAVCGIFPATITATAAATAPSTATAFAALVAVRDPWPSLSRGCSPRGGLIAARGADRARGG
jgi:hypothetical protein